jgi:hypothetical protein
VLVDTVDWADEPAARSPRSCRVTIVEDRRLLVIGLVVSDGEERHAATSTDLTMLAAVKGGEGGAADHGDLHATAGFELPRVLPLESRRWSVIEGRPA